MVRDPAIVSLCRVQITFRTFRQFLWLLTRAQAVSVSECDCEWPCGSGGAGLNLNQRVSACWGATRELRLNGGQTQIQLAVNGWIIAATCESGVSIQNIIIYTRPFTPVRYHGCDPNIIHLEASEANVLETLQIALFLLPRTLHDPLQWNKVSKLHMIDHHRTSESLTPQFRFELRLGVPAANAPKSVDLPVAASHPLVRGPVDIRLTSLITTSDCLFGMDYNESCVLFVAPYSSQYQNIFILCYDCSH